MPDVETARELGQLQERVRGLDSKFGALAKQLDEIDHKIDRLNSLAERSKGAYWAAMGIASAVGAAVSWWVRVFAGPTP